MTSTRNINTFGNYELEQKEFRKFQNYNLDTKKETTYHP